jgi:dephospho-CoA kinase
MFVWYASTHSAPTVIGLTGGIATGKSTVSKLLSHTHHIQVVDADVLARQVVAPGTPALSRIVSTFGPSVLLPDDTLDRKKLGTIVFNDEAKRRQLNAIVHPSVKRAMIKAVLACWFRGEKFCVLDVPLLVESSLWKWVGRVVVVYWCRPCSLLSLFLELTSSPAPPRSNCNVS